MSIFDDVSSVYDRGMQPLEWLIFRRLRRRMFPLLRGAVLELGIGTGVNLPLYKPEAHVTGCDASGEMLAWASRRHPQAPVTLVQADAQRLPFGDGSFDVVTASLVFCSVADPTQGLAESRRVLRPGGRLVLLEHTRGSGLGAWLTEVFHPLWHTWSRECHLNRDTTHVVTEAGFEVQRVERHALGIVRMIEATF
ncbi:MAG: methyltransferase domain-containing protein [Chloroflexota bacterium]|nr:methyltransferase domain-containing protein [Chloroflexota bacterium]